MPRTQTYCEECKAMLTPHANNVDPKTLHVRGCSQGVFFPGMVIETREVWQSSSGATSSEKCPPYHLIPLEALDCEAERFGVGLSKHGRDNYLKAVRAQDIGWMQDRINHGIRHALLWLMEIEGYIPLSGDDHAGAVKWLGSIMKLYGTEAAKQRGGGSSECAGKQ